MTRMASLVGARRDTTAPPPVPEAPVAPAAPPEPGFLPATAAGLLDALQTTLDRAWAVPAGGEFPWPALEQFVVRIRTALETSSDLVWAAHTRPPTTGDNGWLVFHHARSTVLAVHLGRMMKLADSALLDLGVAACLFDVGLLRRLSKTVPAGEAAQDVVADRAHVRRSIEIVRAWSAPRPAILAAIEQHHERELGQGYPTGVRGDAIHQHARILGLADTYLRLIGPHEPHRAICEVVRRRPHEFSPAILRILVDEISMFPPGTAVRLNTGEVGTVVAVNRRQPLRPRVELTTDARGHAVPARVIDLSEAPFLFITGPA